MYSKKLKAFWHTHTNMILIVSAVICGVIAGLLISGCATEVVKQETPDLTDVAEAYCKANPDLNCGHVYACQTYADNPIGLIELCIPQEDPAVNRPTLEQAEGEFGSCELSPSPRFSSSHLCWWCCGPTCGRGCNSFSGCYCPASMVDAGVDSDPNPVPPVKQ